MATTKKNIKNNSEQLRLTSLSDLTRYQEGELVELPPFGPDMPFVAKLRRPSVLSLAKSGKIPNTLMEVANSLFMNDNRSRVHNSVNQSTLADTYEVFDILCNAAFVSPSWSEIKASGVELTDEQLVFIFNYTQRGQKALESFRSEQSNN